MTASRTVVTTSWDDGHRLDPRLADLLTAHGVPGTFYIAPRNIEFDPADRLPAQGIRELAERGFEVGGHTLSHQRLPLISEAAAREEIEAGKTEVEDIVGTAVTSFCYPRGEYTPLHVEQARKAGFTVARTVRRSSLRTGPLLEMTTTVNAYAHRVDGPLALRLAGGRPWRAARLYLEWDELAIHWFELCRRQGGVFHLWGHSWEVDARGDWSRLERVLAHIGGRSAEGVQYATNGELAGLAGGTPRRSETGEDSSDTGTGAAA
ncbi:polysaccharide deacetylase family protein [Streptomyces gilvus]|uniref:polysaccharide deacetylase family protein n=1 Tax=Streptomyces gilvus TaxID=2920937 RepID=UPI001F0F5627|nr:polysaccharide deacetylase family protein [Streptomyces sp. CME 23]MCH5673549.1 polysaccharide deacetylase family protein [Streptomyces sp. CME 23]